MTYIIPMVAQHCLFYQSNCSIEFYYSSKSNF